jgi:hypothetical protein
MKTYNWSQIEPILARHHVSYRQFNYWDECDYLGERSDRPGSGNHRDVPWSMVARACAIGDLVQAGFVPATAAKFVQLAVASAPRPNGWVSWTEHVNCSVSVEVWLEPEPSALAADL